VLLLNFKLMDLPGNYIFGMAGAIILINCVVSYLIEIKVLS